MKYLSPHFLLILISFNIQTQKASPKSLFPPENYAPDYVIDWSKNHYKEKIAEFKNTPIGSDKIVMVGNSLTEGGGDWAKRLKNQNVVNRGISGDVTEGVLKRIGEICYYKPKAVFLLIGINDINGGNKTPEETFHNIFLIVQKIHEFSPHSKVYVQSLLPTVHESLKENITIVNQGLQSGAKSFNYSFIDIYTAFIDSNNLAIC